MVLTERETAEIQRFGTARENTDVPPAKSKELIYADASVALEKYGYEKDGENSSWHGFKSAGSGFSAEAWDGLIDVERAAVEGTGEVPDALKDTYKLCVDVPPEKLPALIEMLGTQFSEIPLYGKIAKSAALNHENFPNLVLYLKGTHINEILDFAISVAKATKSSLGENPSHLDMAKEIEKGSGVFLTQGNYSAKQEAQNSGKLADVYGEDGALFKDTEKKYETYLKRRTNQFVIDETLYNYVGIEKMSERLVALQQRALEGVSEKNLGIRDVNVKVGDYLAPRAEDLEPILDKIDVRLGELIKNPRFEKDYEYAVRVAALAYTLGILAHPLEDGNGQSCTNLVSSLLYEGGYQKIYLGPFLDGRKLRSKALAEVETVESPTVPYDRLSTKVVAKKGSRGQKEADEIEKQNKEREKFGYAQTFLNAALEGDGWYALSNYVDSGVVINSTTSLEGVAANSVLSRTVEVNDFLLNSLKKEPVGSKYLTFAELQMAEEKFDKTPVPNTKSSQTRQTIRGALASPAE